jgi:hypothetical protein
MRASAPTKEVDADELLAHRVATGPQRARTGNAVTTRMAKRASTNAVSAEVAPPPVPGSG